MDDNDDLWRNPKDIIEEMLIGKEGVADKRRQKELEHARQVAAIHAQSHALIWTGTPDELIGTITRWYESGWIAADSLSAALQKASVNFVKPDGSPAILPLVTKPVQPSPETTETNPRRAFVMPLLEKHGWSTLDWANEAGVDKATAADYLNSKSKAFRSTRLKLARALKVSVDKLPK